MIDVFKRIHYLSLIYREELADSTPRCFSCQYLALGRVYENVSINDRGNCDYSGPSNKRHYFVAIGEISLRPKTIEVSKMPNGQY